MMASHYDEAMRKKFTPIYKGQSGKSQGLSLSKRCSPLRTTRDFDTKTLRLKSIQTRRARGGCCSTQIKSWQIYLEEGAREATREGGTRDTECLSLVFTFRWDKKTRDYRADPGGGTVAPLLEQRPKDIRPRKGPEKLGKRGRKRVWGIPVKNPLRKRRAEESKGRRGLLPGNDPKRL